LRVPTSISQHAVSIERFPLLFHFSSLQSLGVSLYYSTVSSLQSLGVFSLFYFHCFELQTTVCFPLVRLREFFGNVNQFGCIVHVRLPIV
ncbi:hypothetical protein L9F63_019867, partial [Diploptera punctata]